MRPLWSASLLSCACVVLVAPSPARAGEQAALEIAGCVARYLRSHDLDQSHPAVERAVIAVHGVERSALLQFRTVSGIVREAGRQERVAVFAPWFPLRAGHPRDLAWASYQTGGPGACVATTAASVSAFAVVDALVARLGDRRRFPALRDVVVVGHSGGGQLAARYAAVSREVARHPDLRFKFVATNPSSWIFLDGRRYVEGRGWVGSGDPALAACPGYDQYGYGTGALAARSFLPALSADELRENWRSRRIVYFVGEADTCVPRPGGPPDQCSSLDDSCAARLQGPSRLARARRFHDAVISFFPPRPGVAHELSIAPGAGHSSSAMYGSAPGRRHILD